MRAPARRPPWSMRVARSACGRPLPGTRAVPDGRPASRAYRRDMTARRRTKRPVIVVGYDGSAASSLAVDVAVERARRIRGRLVIVHADDDERRSHSLLDGLLLEGHDRLSDLEFETLALPGGPARAIAETAEAQAAAEVVVGTRGFGRTRALLGSTSHELIGRTRCPVTVVPLP